LKHADSPKRLVHLGAGQQNCCQVAEWSQLVSRNPQQRYSEPWTVRKRMLRDQSGVKSLKIETQQQIIKLITVRRRSLLRHSDKTRHRLF